MDLNPENITRITVPFERPTIDQLRAELRQLSGLDYLPEVPTLREWMTAEQIAEIAQESQSLNQDTVHSMLHMMVTAARAAYEKGKADQSGNVQEGPR